MSCHYIDFVAFHFAAKRDLRLSFHDALTKLSGHLLGIVTVQIQLVRNLFVREIQAHKIATARQVARSCRVFDVTS